MELEAIVNAMNEKKSEMIKIGMEKGFSHEETIQCSQELDELINEYNRHVLKPKHLNRSNLNGQDYLFPLKWMYKALILPYSYLQDLYNLEVSETLKQFAEFPQPMVVQTSNYHSFLVFPPFNQATQKSYPHRGYTFSANSNKEYETMIYTFATNMNKLGLSFLNIQ
jgi:stage 0 sporulation regulatory protein